MTVKQFWRLWAALLLVELLLVLNMNSDSAPKSRQQTGVRSEPWAGLSSNLTAEAEMDTAQAELMTTTMWGRMASSSGATAAEPPPPVWSLSGVYRVADKYTVILSFERDALPSQQLKVGALLPNGEKIKEIERDKVLVQPAGKGKPHWLPINRTADVSK